MAMLKVARGVLTDIPIFLHSRPGGALVDDRDWVDGSTTPEWPVVAVRNKTTLVDVTDDWVVDISPYAIGAPPPATNLPLGSIKDVDTTTGVWRRTTGTYNLRVQADASLPYTEYQVGVTYDIGSGAFTEWGDIELVPPGDVTLGAEWVTYEEVTAGFNTSLTEEEVQPLIVRATAWAINYLRNRWGMLDTSIDPERVKECIIGKVQSYILTMDLSSGSTGVIAELTEGPDKVKYAGRSDAFISSYGPEAQNCLDIYGKQQAPGRRRRFGVVTREVGYMVDNWQLLGSPVQVM